MREHFPGVIIGAESTVHATIKKGSKGPDVQFWQKFLGITVDGKFGPATETATKNYQTAHGLKADGIVGANTWATTTGIATEVKTKAKVVEAGVLGTIAGLPLWSKIGAATVFLLALAFGTRNKGKQYR